MPRGITQRRVYACSAFILASLEQEDVQPIEVAREREGHDLPTPVGQDAIPAG
jgi:hypothetical protein